MAPRYRIGSGLSLPARIFPLFSPAGMGSLGPRGTPKGRILSAFSPSRARAATNRTTAGGFLGHLQGGRQAGGHPAGTTRPCSTLTGVCPAPFRLAVVRGRQSGDFFRPFSTGEPAKP